MAKIIFNVYIFTYILLGYGFCQEKPRQICIKDTCINVEVADTESTRLQGLMFRQPLAQDSGMLFIFEQEGRTGFWLKNVRFPLDLIWINQDKKIVDIQANAQPCQGEDCLTYYPHKDASFGLEVNAGFAAKHKLRIGDQVDFQQKYAILPL